MNRVCCTLLSVFACPFSVAWSQTTIHVPADQPSIQLAIQAAQNGDTVEVAAGTYVEQIDFLGKAIVVRSSGGAAATVIDSQGMQGWTDYPGGTVVRFLNGEMASSVLEGFTITGGQTYGGSGGNTGVYCSGASPLIRDCIITGNSGGYGGGVLGDPILERCQIIGNTAQPYGPGGGIVGAPTVIECVISNNSSGYYGGGIYATAPCVIIDSVIDSNSAGNGVDGYSGGGVIGPATIISTQITRNTAHYYLDGRGVYQIGTGVDGVRALINCTIADNHIGNPQTVDTGGAIKGGPIIQNCIIWGNDHQPFADFTVPTVDYSIVTGGWGGTGNLALDPLFRDAANGDYFLQLGSPAIDAGDPTSPLDPDGTGADMGSLFFPQYPATVALRNGSGVNPVCFSTQDLPIVGSTLDLDVDATAHGLPAVLTLIVFTFGPASTPIGTAFGEVLVDTTASLLGTSLAAVAGGQSLHQVAVPGDYANGGLVVAAQAVVLGGGVGLCNALDLTIGL